MLCVSKGWLGWGGRCVVTDLVWYLMLILCTRRWPGRILPTPVYQPIHFCPFHSLSGFLPPHGASFVPTAFHLLHTFIRFSAFPLLFRFFFFFSCFPSVRPLSPLPLNAVPIESTATPLNMINSHGRRLFTPLAKLPHYTTGVSAIKSFHAFWTDECRGELLSVICRQKKKQHFTETDYSCRKLCILILPIYI